MEIHVDNQIMIIIAASAAAVIGLLIGLALGRNSSGSSKQARELEEKLQQSQQALEDYKQEVQQHFSDASDAFKKASESYAELHRSLAKGAQDLCDEMPAQGLLAMEETTAENAADDPNQTELPLEPPRDYAPKKTPDDKGVLTEEFGLDKSKPANDAA
jgi:uncharacterized membrane-anchored protein YhcB (DUF1043 family)